MVTRCTFAYSNPIDRHFSYTWHVHFVVGCFTNHLFSPHSPKTYCYSHSLSMTYAIC